MATFLRHGEQWRAQVCVRGRRKSKVLRTKTEAKRWAAEVELALARQIGDPGSCWTLGDLLKRYRDEVSVAKRGHRRESIMIDGLLRDRVAAVVLSDLTPQHIADWRDRRLDRVSGSSVCREMNILSHACNVARREWGWLAANPVSNVRRPKHNPARTRRPTEAETEALLYCLGYDRDQPPETRSARVGAAWLFAIETAMRAGEICGLRWSDVHERHVHLPRTKNGHARDVPLSSEARRIIEQLREVTGERETVFDCPVGSLDALFRKARTKAMIEDLHFHDSRREALTRLCRRFSVMELAKISGHRDLRILQNVYYAPSVEDLADKLD